jgi:hypothetical protein
VHSLDWMRQLRRSLLGHTPTLAGSSAGRGLARNYPSTADDKEKGE